MPIGEQIDICHFNATCNGLTKREHFAGLAMQAVIIGNNADVCVFGAGAAKDALLAADALLAELDKVQQ